MPTYSVLSVIDSIVTEEYTTTGSGYPRLFEDGGIYLYRLHNRLVVTRDAWASTVEIMPSSLKTVAAICQNISSVTTIWQNRTTLYQTSPETASGWSTGGTLVSAFTANDAISPLSGSSLILVGNSHTGNEARAQRNVNPPPFNGWAESDTGLPQTGLTSRITDLRVAE